MVTIHTLLGSTGGGLDQPTAARSRGYASCVCPGCLNSSRGANISDGGGHQPFANPREFSIKPVESWREGGEPLTGTVTHESRALMSLLMGSVDWL